MIADPLRDQVARVRDWYNLVADAFAGRYDDRSGWYFERCEEDVLHAACPLDGRRVLDLGTGAGRLVPRLAARASQVVAADVSEALLRLAPRVPRASLVQMNALDLGFGAATFDTITSLGLFEYVSDFDPFLREIRRVLRDGGTLAFTYHQAAPYRSITAEPATASYFGRTVGERSQYWSKQRHRRAAVRAALARNGFTRARSYRVFFRLPQHLYALSHRCAEGSLGDRVLRGAVLATDRGSAARAVRSRSSGPATS